MATDPDLPIVTVAELGALVGEGVRALFPDDLWIEGQISNLHLARSGHTYFDLVEPNDEPGKAPSALFSVTLWKGNRPGVERTLVEAGGLALADDLVVRLRADLRFYAPRGRLQLNMKGIDPAFTLGRLAAERDRLLRALADEGLLDRNAGLLVPLPPLRVGLVTSVGSAAHADFCTELERSGIGFTILERDARVQGEGSALDVAEGLRVVATHRPDVIALVRGGGSAADLATFDAEVVARTIAALDIPVFTGIGHEIDRSVADEVAHSAFKTPTACAVAIVASARGVLDDLLALRASIVVQAQRAVASASGRQDELAARLRRSADTVLARQGERLDALAARLRALDPAKILARGWSITRTSDGDLVRSVADVRSGDALETRLADGTVTSTVD
jgi:exodeoxyribonuclease VII large subunit